MLKFYSYCMVNYFPQRLQLTKENLFAKCFNSILKVPSRDNWIKFKILHFSSYPIDSDLVPEISIEWHLQMISNSSFHLRSAHDNAINHVGIPSCFTMVRTSFWNFFQYDGEPGIC